VRQVEVFPGTIIYTETRAVVKYEEKHKYSYQVFILWLQGIQQYNRGGIDIIFFLYSDILLYLLQLLLFKLISEN
jgi:hypothetical protein